ncbi:hypothetical protein [Paenibacillus senegalensis]|uniref:hypothetical protein n=1 Tax=Paenibacillus senegalensis TaxID=1465766 RepID=UPI000289ECFC|nr:hypothetical protein [Paenibacillus senegalensis]
MVLEAKLEQILETLAARLQTPFTAGTALLGGSCGLLLQGVRLAEPPKDIDLYADTPDITAIYEQLLPFACEPPALSETDRYRSVLSRFLISGMNVELVGGFQVSTALGQYNVSISKLKEACSTADVGGIRVGLMPLAHELVFNLLRQRPDRYYSIAEKIREEPQLHRPALFTIIKDNSLSEKVIRQVNQLLLGS